MGEFDPVKYKNDFARNNYDRIALNVKLGEKEKIVRYAKACNCSLNSFIVQAIYEKMERVDLK